MFLKKIKNKITVVNKISIQLEILRQYPRQNRSIGNEYLWLVSYAILVYQNIKYI